MAVQPKSPSAATTQRAEVLEALLRRHRVDLQRQAVRHAQRPADADDALQEATVQFLRAYDGPPTVSDALPWMLLAVKRCAWAIARRAPRRRETHQALTCGESDELDETATVLMDERSDPVEQSERRTDASERFALLRRLKPDERTALFLLALGYSYREIAESQSWTHTKVNRCLAEGRAALRESMSDSSPW